MALEIMIKNLLLKSKDHLFILVLIVFSVHMIVATFSHISYITSRLTIVMLLSLYIITSLYSTSKQIYLYKYSLYGFLFLFVFFLQALLSPYIINTTFTFSYQLAMSMYIFLFFLVILIEYDFHEYRKNHLILRLLNIILLLNIIIGSIFFLYFINGNFDINIINKYFANIRFFNHITTIGLPILFLGYFVVKKIRLKVLYGVLIIQNIYFLLYTGARGSSIALFCSYIIILILSKNRFRKRILYIPILFTFTSLILFYISSFNGTASHMTHLLSMSSAGRKEIYEHILPYLFDYKYIFYALGFFSEPIIECGNVLHPHNLLLFIFLGGGSFVLLIFVYVLVKMFLYIIPLINKEKKISPYFLYWSFISFFIHSMVSGLYIVPLTNILFLILLIAILKYFFQVKHKPIFIINKHIIVVVVMICCFYIISLLGELNKPILANNSNQKKMSRIYSPGFFLHHK